MTDKRTSFAPGGTPVSTSHTPGRMPALVSGTDGPGPAETAAEFEWMWQEGDWERLSETTDAALAAHPDRIAIAPLVAAAAWQLGDETRARKLAARALDWGATRRDVGRALLIGIESSFGRLAALLDDTPRAEALFSRAAAHAGHRDPRTGGQMRLFQDFIRLDRLPEAAALIGTRFKALYPEGPLPRAQERILKSQIAILNEVLRGALKHGRIGAAPRNDTAPATSLSTAQLGQDLWVLERTGQKRGGWFIEFGATDGVLLSNTLLLERDYGWQGLCAEPNPGFFSELAKNRNCQVTEACIGARSGETVEFVLADEFGTIADYAESDLQSSTRTAYREAGETITLTTTSLDTVLKAHGAPRRIDYLSIDTEGSEYDILAAFPFEDWDIHLLTVEHNFTPQRERIRVLLEGYGYVRTEAQWDDWYERPDLAPDAEAPARRTPA